MKSGPKDLAAYHQQQIDKENGNMSAAELHELKMTPDALAERARKMDEIARERFAPQLNAQTFTVPEVPAAVQEAGDKNWSESAKTLADASPKRAPRSDKGTKRPKPQPVPEPEQKAAGITTSQAHTIKGLVEAVHLAREAFAAAQDELENAQKRFDSFIDSLAK